MVAGPSKPVIPAIDGFLHEPSRLRLLAFLSVLERADFVYLLNKCGLTRGNLSVQMSKLSDAGLVSIEKSFRDNKPRTMYRLTDQGRQALRKYKKDMAVLMEALPD
jgi:DNA-binding MarR family transcriptional regulator